MKKPYAVFYLQKRPNPSNEFDFYIGNLLSEIRTKNFQNKYDAWSFFSSVETAFRILNRETQECVDCISIQNILKDDFNKFRGMK